MKKLGQILSENFQNNRPFNLPKDAPEQSTNRKYSKVKRAKKNQDFFDFMGLVERWGEIVGEGLIPYTHPLKNKNEILTVLVSHPGFALQLGFLEENIKSKIIKMFPQLISHLKKINFVTDPEFFKDPKKNENIKMVKMRSYQTNEENIHAYSPRGIEIKKDPHLVQALESLFIQFIPIEDITP